MIHHEVIYSPTLGRPGVGAQPRGQRPEPGSDSLLNSGLNLDPNALSILSNSFDVNGLASNFDPASLGLNLGQLNVPGLNINNLDFGNQNSMAQAIQALLSNLCLNNVFDQNNLLNLGRTTSWICSLQLAQLEQLQQLGFLGLGDIGNLVNSGFGNNLNNIGNNIGNNFGNNIATTSATTSATKASGIW